jgi:hypothetical protein
MTRFAAIYVWSIFVCATASAHSIDKEAFEKALKPHKVGFSRCFSDALKRRPKLEGKVVFRFSIDPAKPLGVKILESPGDETMDKCLVSEAKQIRFPRFDLPIFLN